MFVDAEAVFVVCLLLFFIIGDIFVWNNDYWQLLENTE